MPTSARADHGRTTVNVTLSHARLPVVLFGILSLVGPSLLVAAQRASTPVGTSIVNIATVSASVTAGMPPVAVSSNPAVTLVSVASLSGLSKTVAPADTIQPGSTLRYTLGFQNSAAVPLTGVVLSDPLDPFIAAVSDVSSGTIPNLAGGGHVALTGSYDPSLRKVTWAIPSLPAGFRGEVSFRATLAASIPDETFVRNAFTGVADQDPAGKTSPEVTSAVVAPSLSLSLVASRDRVEMGDPVGFDLRVSNLSQSLDLAQSVVIFTLPKGFRFLAGSLRVGGAKLNAVSPGGPPRELQIPIGDLPRGENRQITLVGIAGAGVHRGEVEARGKASASTSSGIPVEAIPVEVPIQVVEGALLSEAVIAGKVFVDTDADGIQSSSEPSVPGVRLFLEDGTQVLTDIAGKYHFEGIRPGMHVLKLDPETAPSGLAPVASQLRSAGSSGVQFIDLGAADLFKANFTLRGDRAAVSALRIEVVPVAGAPATALAARSASPMMLGAEPVPPPILPPVLASVLFENGSATLRREAEGLIESCAQLTQDLGVVKGEVKVTVEGESDLGLGKERERALQRALSKALKLQSPATPEAPSPKPALVASIIPVSAGKDPKPLSTEEILKALPPGLFILSPKPGQIILAEFTDVEVAFPTGRHLHLAVNGIGVGEDRIGVRMQTSRSGMSLHRFMGLALREGENILTVESETDEDAPQRIEIRVDRVGSPARISIRGEGGAQQADGRTPGRIILEVRDEKGHPALDGTLVTVDPASGSVLGVDADPMREGFQVRTMGGQATARLSPADQGETRSITATSGHAEGKAEILFGPHLRNWIVAGLGEAGWSGSGAPATGPDAGFGAGDPFGDPGASSRLALFAKGKVGDDGLLSLSFDSARVRDESRLFRTQDPAGLFPIYGDSSRQAYDLESQGKLAVRWERDRTMIMYGDFMTGLSSAELTRYDRALSGALTHVETKAMSIHAFGATTHQSEVRDAFGGEGSSGPYRLSNRSIVAYSERVTFEIRDRFHSEKVIGTSAQSRFTDYDIDYNGGTILFRSAVNAQDANFNPVTIVVTYETLDAGSTDVVAGGRIGWHANPKFDWGTTAVHEDRAGSPFSLTGTDFTFRPWAGAAITTEYARAADAGRVSGALALRLNASLGPKVTMGAYVRQIPKDYSNPSMTGVSEVGTFKEGIELHAGLPDGSHLTAESYKQEQSIQGTDHSAAGIGWEKPDGPITYEAGTKAVAGTAASGTGSDSSGLVTMGLRARIGPRFDASVRRQQIVAGETVSGFPTRTDLGAGYRFNDQVRGFLREEFDGVGAESTSRTLLGVEGALSDTTTLESRYTMEDALNGARGYATLGVRTRIPLSDLWSADVRGERSETVFGTPGSDFTSLSAAAAYLPGKSKFTSQYEVRFGAQDTRQLLTTTGAIKLNPDLSLFARQRMNLIEPDLGASHLDADGLVGLAYRPVDSDRFNWLGRVQANRGQSLPGGGTSLTGAPDARGLLGIFEVNTQPARRWHLLGRYGGRFASDTFAGSPSRLYSELWEGRCLADAGRRQTIGLSVRYLRQPGTDTSLTGVGLETGFMVAKNLWLVSGYNITGFSDRRFPDGDRRSQGPFVSLRFKFDETLLEGLKSPPREPLLAAGQP